MSSAIKQTKRSQEIRVQIISDIQAMNGEVESLICNFYLSVAARKNVYADPSLRYTSMLLGR